MVLACKRCETDSAKFHPDDNKVGNNLHEPHNKLMHRLF